MLPLLATGTLHAAEVVWKEGFEQGLDGVTLYYQKDDRSLLSLATEQPVEGSHSVKMQLPGNRDLEGFQVVAEVPPNRLVTVRAKVKGTAKLLVCLHSATGWAYSPPVTLSDNWREVKISKTTGINDQRLRICFLGQGKQPGAAIEADDVEVSVEPELNLQETDVAPIRYQAAAYAAKTAIRRSAEGALAPEVLGGNGKFQLNQVPFPQTKAPVSVYLRISATTGGKIDVKSSRGGTFHSIRTVSFEGRDGWQWVEIPNVTAEEIGETFFLGFAPSEAEAETLVDSLVLSTRQGLDEHDLNKAPEYDSL